MGEYIIALAAAMVCLWAVRRYFGRKFAERGGYGCKNCARRKNCRHEDCSGGN